MNNYNYEKLLMLFGESEELFFEAIEEDMEKLRIEVGDDEEGDIHVASETIKILKEMLKLSLSKDNDTVNDAKVVIVTDGCDNDGRVSSLYMKKYYTELKMDSKVLYLDRNRLLMEEPKWINRKSSGTKEIDLDIFKNKIVVFTDICLDYETMSKINEMSDDLIVLDHHKVDDRILNADWYSKYSTGNTVPSASMLAYEYTEKSEKLSLSNTLATIVSDRDTFEKKIIESEYFYIYTTENNIDDNELLDIISGGDISDILNKGKKLYLEYQKEITNASNELLVVKYDTYKVGYTENIEPRLISDLGNYVCKKYDIDLYINVSKKDNKYRTAIRSLNGQALIVAKEFNGGGHPNAAGCLLNKVEIVDNELHIS